MNRRRFLAALPAGAMALAQSGGTEVAGKWEGTLVTPGGSLRLALEISKASDGVYLGMLTSIDQGGARIPIDTIRADGGSVHLELKAVLGVFDGRLVGTSKLSGTWRQGGPAPPLEFTRAGTAAAETAKAAPPKELPFGPPLDLAVPIGPTPFPARGKQQLVYELHLTNFNAGGQEVLLKRIEVLDGSAAVASYEGSELASILMRVGGAGDDKRLLDAGRRAVAFVWVTIGGGERVPSALRHRITVGEQAVEGAVKTVSQVKPLVLGPPLRGSGWMAANGPSIVSIHRRAVIAVNGRARIAQRFAIDWVKVGANGKTFEGAEAQNKTHFAYGSEALAVADALVATVKDGIPENVPGLTSRAVPITLETVGGNHIILDLGGGQFGFYAHLQPGSIRVKAGDRVKRGQAMALVGNTGNSTEPHLHFHVSDGNSPLGSEGLPYVLDAWKNEMPMQNDRVDFG